MAVLATLLATSGGCDSGNEDATDAVQEAFDIYTQTVLAGDADGWIEIWTDEPVAFWPDQPAVSGKAAMVAALEHEFGVLDYTEFDIEVLEVVTAGDWAYARGTFTAAVTSKETGEEGGYDGKFLTIFQKQSGGSWKIHRDIYNSNMPPASD